MATSLLSFMVALVVYLTGVPAVGSLHYAGLTYFWVSALVGGLLSVIGLAAAGVLAVLGETRSERVGDSILTAGVSTVILILSAARSVVGLLVAYAIPASATTWGACDQQRLTMAVIGLAIIVLTGLTFRGSTTSK